MKRYLLLICVCTPLVARGQYSNMSQTPQPPAFQQVMPGTQSSYGIQQYQYPLPQVQMGATAEDILRQVNRDNPYYGYSNDPASNQRATEAWIHK